MTTCRSEFTLAVLLVLAAGAAPAARAQEAPRPATHTVRPGDTLWDLARQYLGDPFLWPQIYRLNTDVVEDPHWIYPGEVLRLAAGAETRAVPAEPGVAAEPAAPGARQPAVAEEWTEEGALFPRRRAVDASAALVAYRDLSYRALRPGEFHSAGFLTEGQDLPFGRFLGNVTPLQIHTNSDRSFTLLNDLVAVVPPEGATYRVGDSLLVVELELGVSGRPEWGDVVRPTGLLVVTAPDSNQVVAAVRSIYGEIRSGQRVLPAERFVPSGEQRAQPVANGVTGRVIRAREEHPMRHPLDILFLDVGRSNGVAAGDLFEVLREPGASSADRSTEEVMGTLQVVHVRERSATVRILTVTSPDFPDRALVRQVARLPR